MTPDIFDIVALVIIFLCYCAGRYFLGPWDAKKEAPKHDGRRAAYRGGILALVLAFIVWRTTYGVWPAVLTWVSGCLAGSIGVRLGWNAARGLDWRYLGSTSADDRLCIRMAWSGSFFRDVIKHHSHIYNRTEMWYQVRVIWEGEPYDYTVTTYGYRNAVHRAGLIRTVVEGAVSVVTYTLLICL